ncbi:hypothetical protein Bpfe_028086, partial [Biomphalaria pfeifferi]
SLVVTSSLFSTPNSLLLHPFLFFPPYSSSPLLWGRPCDEQSDLFCFHVLPLLKSPSTTAGSLETLPKWFLKYLFWVLATSLCSGSGGETERSSTNLHVQASLSGISENLLGV